MHLDRRRRPCVVSNFALKSAGALAVSAAGVRSLTPARRGRRAGLAAKIVATNGTDAATRTTAARTSERRITISLRNIKRAFTGENRLPPTRTRCVISPPLDADRHMHVARAAHLHALQAQHGAGLVGGHHVVPHKIAAERPARDRPSRDLRRCRRPAQTSGCRPCASSMPPAPA